MKRRRGARRTRVALVTPATDDDSTRGKAAHDHVVPPIMERVELTSVPDKYLVHTSTDAVTQQAVDTSPASSRRQAQVPPARYRITYPIPAEPRNYHDRARAEVGSGYRNPIFDHNVDREHNQYNWSEHRERQPIPRNEGVMISRGSDEFDENARQTEAEINIIDTNSGTTLNSFLQRLFLSPEANIGRVLHKYVRTGHLPRFDIIIPVADQDQFIGLDSFGAPDTLKILEHVLGRSVGTDTISFQEIRTDYVPDNVCDALKLVCNDSDFVNSYGSAEYGHIDVSTCDNILRMYEALVRVYNTLTIFEALSYAGWKDRSLAQARQWRYHIQTLPSYFELLSYEEHYPDQSLPKVAWVLEDMYCENMKTIYHKHIDSVRDLLNSLNDSEFERVNLRPETFRILESVLWDRGTALRQINLSKKYQVHRTEGSS